VIISSFTLALSRSYLTEKGGLFSTISDTRIWRDEEEKSTFNVCIVEVYTCASTLAWRYIGRNVEILVLKIQCREEEGLK
jgi:hypothetical protein